MYLERKQDLSINYWLQDLFSTTPFVTVVDGFPEDELQNPTIAITADSIEVFQLELGNRVKTQVRTWFIDIFGLNKSQRDEFAYYIFNELDNVIPVYNYDEGFPPAVTPSQIGCLDTQEKRLKIIEVSSELVPDLYYRAEIRFNTTYQVN